MRLKNIAEYLGFGRRQKRVLVVDDGASSLNEIANKLMDSGYQINFDGAFAGHDLILVDMDVNDRADFLKKTRGIDKKIPIVAVVEQSEMKVFRAYDDGANYCMTRPVDPEHALNVVNYLIGDLPEEEKEGLERVW